MRSVAWRRASKRKVRATSGTMFPNGKPTATSGISDRNDRLSGGKGEKAG